MVQDFILPDIGEGIVECELVEWLVEEGQFVEEDQPVCDVMTDKALVQIPAKHSGVIVKLHYNKGDIALVHQPLFAVDVADEAGSSPTDLPSTTPVNAPSPVSATGSVLEDFILPDIGEGIVECELVEWLVSEGDQIEEDQAVCDVMTDKAMVQIPAKHKGVITKLYYQKGETAIVHTPLFQISRESQAGEVAPVSTAVQSSVNAAAKEVSQAVVVSNGKALASPAVRRLAREHGIDLSQVAGSGKNGRVYKEDVKSFMSGAQKTAPAAQPAVRTQVVASAQDKVVPIKGVQAAMAKQMVASVSTIPHFTMCDEIDLTDLIALRASVKDDYASDDVKITMMPFFIKALSLALNEFPIINSRVNDDCTELTYLAQHNIGMAVDSKMGLIVPNIKQCEARSILAIAKEVTRLTNSAREGRIAQEDLKGGTISISNIGAIGATVATPIINKPEVAIVALGKVQHLPRFDANGNVVSRSIMQISWSGDHRVIDGATMARFNNLWKKYLEQPHTMMLAMS